MAFSRVFERQKSDTLCLRSAFPSLSFIWTTPRPACGVCCTPACPAQRRKWRVLVPILHLWSSLGKEAPLHLLLFAVADIISFPAQSVRVSCHSVKILLCYWEGFATEKEGGKEDSKKEWKKGGRGRCVSIKPACLEMREPVGQWSLAFQKKSSAWVSNHTLPSSVCSRQTPSEQKPALLKFPFLVSRRVLPLLFKLAKEEKAQTVMP